MQTTTCSPRRRNAGLIAGGIFSILIGALALVLALRGFQGKGGPAELATTWPNLITGIASLVGGGGYLAQRKWAVPVYAVAVVGHFVSHGMLFVMHSGATISLVITPLLALAVLFGMNNCRAKGRLV